MAQRADQPSAFACGRVDFLADIWVPGLRKATVKGACRFAEEMATIVTFGENVGEGVGLASLIPWMMRGAGKRERPKGLFDQEASQLT